jgi:hypothetical protein
VALVPAVTEEEPLAVTARSALVVRDPLTVAVLLPVFGSVVLLVTEAVSEKAAPFARLLGAETTTVKVSLLPFAIEVADSVTVPLD